MAYAELLNEKEVLDFIGEIRRERGQNYRDDLIDNIFEIIDDLPRIRAIRRELLNRFLELRPERCGRVNVETGEVIYNEEKYTEWNSNYPLFQIHDLLFVFDYVGLDYELRLANRCDPSDGFTIYIPNDEEEKEKRALAEEIHYLFDSKYSEAMRAAGIDVKWNDNIYWGCEKELCPDKYGTDDRLISLDEYESMVKGCYEEAYYRAVQRVFELKFEKKIDETGRERKYCKAKLDEKHLKKCKKVGYFFQSINISPEKFLERPISEEERHGIKVYTFEFFL